MDDLPLIVKYAEVMIMEILVGAAVVAILIAGVCDIVEAKVLESRRRDHIAIEPELETSDPSQPATPQPVAGQPTHRAV